MDSYARHAGDSDRPINVTFPDGVVLTGASVRLEVADRHGTELLNGEMTITNQTDPATATYAPAAGELDVEGIFLMTVEVTYLGGEIETFPTPGFARLLVDKQLATESTA
jgi:hypothetical protein